MKCEHSCGCALPHSSPSVIKNRWVVSVLQMWEWLCTDFLRYFQIMELKGALYHSLLSSAAGWGSARGVWLPWGAAGACGPLLLAGECGEPQG